MLVVLFWFFIKKCLGEIGCSYLFVKEFDSDERKVDLEMVVESG